MRAEDDSRPTTAEQGPPRFTPLDVDGDGHQDIVATRTDERPLWLRGDIWMS